jgi:hypothetical protein
MDNRVDLVHTAPKMSTWEYGLARLIKEIGITVVGLIINVAIPKGLVIHGKLTDLRLKNIIFYVKEIL